LRFQTEELNIRVIYTNAVSGEQQDSIQHFENRFRSGGVAYLIFINKWVEFSQSLSRVLAGCDIIWQKPNITEFEIY